MDYKLLVIGELWEYDANLVELWEVVPYGWGVGSNDADDVTNKSK